jgi:acetyl esterase
MSLMRRRNDAATASRATPRVRPKPFSGVRPTQTATQTEPNATPRPAGGRPWEIEENPMSERAHPTAPVLEPAAAAFAEATSRPPFLFQLPPAEGRKAVDEVQSGGITGPAVEDEWVTVQGGPTGSVRARIVRPSGATGTLPVILYLHGAGWVFGNAHTHDRLVRELATGTGAAVVFPEYSLSPESRYPVAIEQNYTVARWVVTDGAANRLDASRLAVAGDSVGGNMAAALTLLAKERGDLPLVQQVLFYPVTDAAFDTGSYHQSAHAAEAAIGLAISTLRKALTA